MSAPRRIPPPRDLDGLGWGLRLHRWFEPREWPRELEKVPEGCRAEAEQYLRGIAARLRYQRSRK